MSKPPKLRRTLLGYCPPESPIFSLHPMVRIILLLLMSAYPLIIEGPLCNFMLILFVVALIKYSGLPFFIFRRYIPLVLSFTFFISIAHIFLGGYDPEYTILYAIGPIKIALENLRNALIVYVRLLVMIFTIIFFVNTITEREIIIGLRTLRTPFTVTYMLGMALKAIGMTFIDYDVILQAQKSRGIDLERLPIHKRLINFGLTMIPVLTSEIRRATEMADALNSRGYEFTGFFKSKKRTEFAMREYKIRKKDTFIISMLIGFLMILIILRTFNYLTFAWESGIYQIVWRLAG